MADTYLRGPKRKITYLDYDDSRCEALEKMGKFKGEGKIRNCGYCGGNTHTTKDCKYEKMEKY